MMIYSFFDRNSRPVYTYINELFDAFKGRQREYNWLITDCDIVAHSPELERLDAGGYHFLTGEALSEIVYKDPAQWIWGVLIGFDQSIPIEKIFEYPLPTVDYEGYHKSVPIMQHPLSTLEIVPVDSSFLLMITKQKEIADLFHAAFPACERWEMQ